MAIKAAEDSYDAVKGEVLKYIPDQAKGVEDAIKGAKENFDKGNFDAALARQKPIPDKVKELTTAVAAKKAELAKSWEEMSGGLPKMLEAIKSRLDILSASKKLPENWTRRSSKAPRAATRRRPRCGTTRRQPSPEATWPTR